MKLSNSTVPMMPRSCGNVTCRKVLTRPAPSMAAASYSSLGIVCSPASSITMIHGNVFHVFAMITAAIARCGCPSQLMLVSISPTSRRKPFSTP